MVILASSLCVLIPDCLDCVWIGTENTLKCNITNFNLTNRKLMRMVN